MIVLAYLGSQCKRFHADFLRRSIWSRVSALKQFRDVSDMESIKFCVNLGAKVRQRPSQ
jgi:hypothetical protein